MPVDIFENIIEGSEQQRFRLLAGAPTDGVSYAGIAAPGQLLIDTLNKTLYQNTGTQASPIWTLITPGAGGGGTIGGSGTSNKVALFQSGMTLTSSALTQSGSNLTASGDVTASGLLKAGSGPVTLTDAAGKVLSAALNTVGTGQGGTGGTTPSAARTNLGLAIGSDIPGPTGTGASGTWGIDISGSAAGLSGTLPVNKGGTNITAPTNNRVMMGNGTGYTQGVIGSGLSWDGTNLTAPSGGIGGSGAVGSVPVFSGLTTTLAASPITLSGSDVLINQHGSGVNVPVGSETHVNVCCKGAKADGILVDDVATTSGSTDITIPSGSISFTGTKNIYLADAASTGSTFTATMNAGAGTEALKSTLTASAGTPFTSTTAGMRVWVPGAGPNGADLVAQVETVSSNTVLILSDHASTNVTGVTCKFATDLNTTATLFNPTTLRLAVAPTISHPKTKGSLWTTDDGPAIQAAIEDLAANKPGCTLYFPAGVYNCSTQIAPTTNGANISIQGDLGAVLDGRACTSTSSNGLLYLTGTKDTAKTITTIPAKGTNTVVVPKSGFTPPVKGDIILIHDSASRFHANTLQATSPGEMQEVTNVEDLDGTNYTLTIRGFWQDNYDTGDGVATPAVTITVIHAPRVTVQNLRIERSLSILTAGMSIQNARDVYVRGCRVRGAQERCYWLNYCYNSVFVNNYTQDAYRYIPATGTNYALAVDASQNTLIEGNELISGRHAIKQGGNDPTRDTTIIGNFIANDQRPSAPAIDAHVNVERCKIAYNMIIGGILLNSEDNLIQGNTVIGNTVGGIRLQTTSPTCVSQQILNNNVTVPTSASGVNPILVEIKGGATAAGISAYGTHMQALTISENTVNNQKAGNHGIMISAVGANGIPLLDNLELRDNHVYTVGGTISALKIDRSTVGFQITNCLIDGGEYQSTQKPAFLDVDAYGRCVVRNVIFTQATGQNGCEFANGVSTSTSGGGWRNLIIDNCTFKVDSLAAPSGGPNFFGCSGPQMQITNCKFQSFATNHGVCITTTNDVLWYNNQFINCASSAISIKANTRLLSSLGNNQTGYLTNVNSPGGNASGWFSFGAGTTAPAGGVWQVGDVAFPAAPATGVASAFYCSTAGTAAALVSVTCTVATTTPTTPNFYPFTVPSANANLLREGMIVAVAGLTGTYTINSLDAVGNTGTFSTVPNTTVTAGAVSNGTTVAFKQAAVL